MRCLPVKVIAKLPKNKINKYIVLSVCEIGRTARVTRAITAIILARDMKQLLRFCKG